jgi:hypothetical protein
MEIRDRTISLVVTPGALTIKTSGSIPSPATWILYFLSFSHWVAKKKQRSTDLNTRRLEWQDANKLKKERRKNYKENWFKTLKFIHVYIYILLPYI